MDHCGWVTDDWGLNKVLTRSSRSMAECRTAMNRQCVNGPLASNFAETSYIPLNDLVLCKKKNMFFFKCFSLKLLPQLFWFVECMEHSAMLIYNWNTIIVFHAKKYDTIIWLFLFISQFSMSCGMSSIHFLMVVSTNNTLAWFAEWNEVSPPFEIKVSPSQEFCMLLSLKPYRKISPFVTVCNFLHLCVMNKYSQVYWQNLLYASLIESLCFNFLCAFRASLI